MTAPAVPQTFKDLRHLPPMREFSDGDLALVFSEIAVRFFAAGEVWERATFGLAIIWSGAMRVGHLAPSGQFISMRLMAPGDIIGIVGAFSNISGETLHIVTDTPVVALQISAPAARTLVDTCAGFRHLILQSFTHMVMSMGDRLFEFGTMPARTRLQSELLRLAMRGYVVDGMVVINPAPTHEALATQIGVSREVVSRFMKDLNDAGLVQSRRGEIVILNYAKLREAVATVGGRIEDWEINS